MDTPPGLDRRIIDRMFNKVVAIHPRSGIGTFGEGYVAHVSAGSYRFVLYDTGTGFADVLHEHDGMPGGRARHGHGDVVERARGLSRDLAVRWLVREALPRIAPGIRFHKLVWARFT